MIKATLTKSEKHYVLTSESGTVVDLGNRYPSAKKMREAFNAALHEEVIIEDTINGTTFTL